MSTAIQWTDETWNPITGCTRVSEGCRHCYIERTPAFRMAGRKFVNGTTGVQLHPDRLDQPLHWKKPRRVFVNSLSDLFHEDVPFDFIASVFFYMAFAERHQFQVLTKRPQRMLEFFDRWERDEFESLNSRSCTTGYKAPIKNVWLGVSAEDQRTADERIPLLLQTPAALRFVSAEPLLEPVQLGCGDDFFDHGIGKNERNEPRIHWVIVGGESGPGARPCDITWIRSIVEQCKAADVPVFVKQIGSNPLPFTGASIKFYMPDQVGVALNDKKGGDPAEWPADLRVREYPR